MAVPRGGAPLILGAPPPRWMPITAVSTGGDGAFDSAQPHWGEHPPRVYTCDMREELMAGNRSIFSGKLSELIRDRLDRREQMMLFINLRGYAKFVMCRGCGHVIKWPPL